jgi:uncharacterized protein (DUF58 family)
MAKLAAHRAALVDITTRLGWSFLVHHTDKPATEPLLALINRLQGAFDPPARTARPGSAP